VAHGDGFSGGHASGGLADLLADGLGGRGRSDRGTHIADHEKNPAAGPSWRRSLCCWVLLVEFAAAGFSLLESEAASTRIGARAVGTAIGRCGCPRLLVCTPYARPNGDGGGGWLAIAPGSLPGLLLAAQCFDRDDPSLSSDLGVARNHAVPEDAALFFSLLAAEHW